MSSPEDPAEILDDLILTYDDVVGSWYESLLWTLVGWAGLAALVFFIATKALIKHQQEQESVENTTSDKNDKAATASPVPHGPEKTKEKLAAAATDNVTLSRGPATAPGTLTTNGTTVSTSENNKTIPYPSPNSSKWGKY